MKRVLVATGAVALGLAVALPVAAQQFGHGRMHHAHGGFGGGFGGGPGGFARMCENQDARMAGMLAFAEKKLNITEAQKPAWTTFTRAAEASHGPVDKVCAELKDKPAAATLPDRLERMQTVMGARFTQFQQMLPAVKELYGQLTPEQQKIADEFMNRGRGMGGPGDGGPRDGAPGRPGQPG